MLSATENTEMLGTLLFTSYGYPFLIAGYALFIAMVGAIVIFMFLPYINSSELRSSAFRP